MRVVDTGFLVDLLLGDEGAVEKAREIDERGWAATTAVNVYELVFSLSFCYELEPGDWLPAVESLLGRLDVFPLDSMAALEAGRILGSLWAEYEEVEPFHGLVAAIVKVNGCESIVTRNVERYGKFKGLKIESY